MSLVDYLRGQIKGDEARATARLWHEEGCGAIPVSGEIEAYSCDCRVPEQLLREAHAKRRIVERCAAIRQGGDHPPKDDETSRDRTDALALQTLRELAAGYDDPDDCPSDTHFDMT